MGWMGSEERTPPAPQEEERETWEVPLPGTGMLGGPTISSSWTKGCSRCSS